MKKILTLLEVMPFGAIKTGGKRGVYWERCRDLPLVERCERAWNNLEDARKQRERILKYVFGDQWSDVIEYKNGTITERQFLKMRGNIPLTNNIMISIFNAVQGLYTKQGSEPLCFARAHDAQRLSDMMSATMQANWQDTHMKDLLAHAFGEYIIGGVMLARENYEEREQVFDAYTQTYDLPYVFWEKGNDPRNGDLQLIGVLHDISWEEMLSKFSRPEYGLNEEILSGIYQFEAVNPANVSLQQNERNRLDYIDFHRPSDLGKFRVIEVWSVRTKERFQCYDPLGTSMDKTYFRCEIEDIIEVDETNKQRRKLYDEQGVSETVRAYIQYRRITDLFWQFSYLAPDGTVLFSGETPYDFKSHPFTLAIYPFINGEIHPFMGNIIDQNRFINRLIVMHDMAVRSAAKGVTLIPTENIPDGMTPCDFADEFTAYDGLVFYDTNRINPNLKPEIITSNATQIGTTELLQLEINLIERISNVNGALQGKTPTTGTSATRYAMEAQNSTTSLYKLLQDMTSFSENVAKKKCYMIKQFYPDGKLIFNENNGGNNVLEYDKMSTRDVMFKISIKEAAASAAYQMQANDTMRELLSMGAINVMQYLQNVNLPFADGLLHDLQTEQAQRQAIAERQQIIQQQGGADNENVEKAQNALTQ